MCVTHYSPQVNAAALTVCASAAPGSQQPLAALTHSINVATKHTRISHCPCPCPYPMYALTLPLTLPRCRYFVPNPAYSGASCLNCFSSPAAATRSDAGQFSQQHKVPLSPTPHKSSSKPAAAGGAGKLAWQQVQYGASASRRRTISAAGRSPQHHQQQVQLSQQQLSGKLMQQQQHLMVQTASYGASFDPCASSGVPFAAAYSHDFAGSGGALRTATSRRSDSDSGSGKPSFDGDTDCGSSSSSIHVSIRIARSGGGAAAGAGRGAAPKELELLKGVSGFAVPGNLMALMGGSGAGECGCVVLFTRCLHSLSCSVQGSVCCTAVLPSLPLMSLSCLVLSTTLGHSGTVLSCLDTILATCTARSSYCLASRQLCRCPPRVLSQILHCSKTPQHTTMNRQDHADGRHLWPQDCGPHHW